MRGGGVCYDGASESNWLAIMRNFRRFKVVRPALLATILLLTCPRAFAAEDWTAAARSLESKIAPKLKPGLSWVLSFRNVSSLLPDEAERARAAMVKEMRAQGLRIIENDGKAGAPEQQSNVQQNNGQQNHAQQNNTEIQITLAESLNGYLWVAEISAGESREVVMQAVPRWTSTQRPRGAPLFLLQSQKLLEQEAPILDFELIDGPLGRPRLLVLEPNRVILRVSENGSWQSSQIAALAETENQPRDFRGLLKASGSAFEIFLPGIRCQGVSTEALAAQCSRNEQPWEFDLGEAGKLHSTLVAGKNFFSSNNIDGGAARSFPLFFSAAGLKINGDAVWAISGIDGRARLYNVEKDYNAEKGAVPLVIIEGWGSEIASLKTDCGTSRQILATRPGDWTERDAIQAFEIADKQMVEVSPPLEFSGPVMTLRQSKAGGTARAVIRSLQTGRYEAHTVSLSCGR